MPLLRLQPHRFPPQSRQPNPRDPSHPCQLLPQSHRLQMEHLVHLLPRPQLPTTTRLPLRLLTRRMASPCLALPQPSTPPILRWPALKWATCALLTSFLTPQLSGPLHQTLGLQRLRPIPLLDLAVSWKQTLRHRLRHCQGTSETWLPK